MTLNVQYSWQDYTTDGVQTVFPYPFYVKEKLDLTAYWEALGTPPWHPGAPVTAPLPSAFYTLTGLGQPSGGTLVTQTPLPSGRLVLRRGTPQNQLTDYVEGDAFPAASHETALDRLTVLVQDHQEVLSRAALLRVETGTPHRGLTLPDPLPNTVLGWDSLAAQWTLYPSGVTAIPIDPVSGIGWGKNTVVVTPAAGASQASGLVFPAGVLALAVTVWVETTLGQTQGLQQVGVGTADRPDCWGVLTGFTAASETTAGLFQGYSGQPQPVGGMVTLTAYGGPFDGTGTVYLTGYFTTFAPGRAEGYLYTPSTPEAGQILPPLPAASETQAGILALATQADTTTGTDDARAVTPLKLAQRLAALPSASETVAGLAELATQAEVTTGTDAARIVTPLTLASRLATATLAGLVELATSPETTTGTDATRAVTPASLAAKLPSGTALSVARYAASGTALEATPGLVTTASGSLGVGVTPESGQMLQVQGTLRIRQGNLACFKEGGGVMVWAGTVYSDTAADCVEFQVTKGAGTEASPQATPAGATLLALRARGMPTGGAGIAFGAGLTIETTEVVATGRGTQLRMWTTLTGATSQAERLKIDGSGNLVTWGGLCGLGTPLTATLGAGASYQALSVKGSQLFVGQSSVQERPVAALTATMPVSTDATRTGRLTLSAYDSVALREVVRVEADGTAGRLGFYGSTAVVRPTVAAAASDAATTQTLANSLRTALLSLGLCV